MACLCGDVCSNGCGLTRESMVIYEAEEALVPMNADDLSAKVSIMEVAGVPPLPLPLPLPSPPPPPPYCT